MNTNIKFIDFLSKIISCRTTTWRKAKELSCHCIGNRMLLPALRNFMQLGYRLEVIDNRGGQIYSLKSIILQTIAFYIMIGELVLND